MQRDYPMSQAIVPSDTVAPAGAVPVHAIYVGGVGDVTIVPPVPANAAAVTFKAVPVGTTLYCQARLVKATGTTATLLVGMGG